MLLGPRITVRKQRKYKIEQVSACDIEAEGDLLQLMDEVQTEGNLIGNPLPPADNTWTLNWVQ